MSVSVQRASFLGGSLDFSFYVNREWISLWLQAWASHENGVPNEVAGSPWSLLLRFAVGDGEGRDHVVVLGDSCIDGA